MNWLPLVPHPSRVYRYFHSRFRRLDIEPEAVHEVLREYGLESGKPPRNLPMGWRNRSVIVNTPAGMKVLRSYKPKWPLSTVVCEHSILARLEELNVSTLRPVPGRNGQTWAVRPGGLFALFDYIDGTTCSLAFMPRSLRLTLMAASGRELGRFHRGLRGFVPKSPHHQGFASYTADRQPNISGFLERVNVLKEESSHLRPGRARKDAQHLIAASAFMTDALSGLDNLLRLADLPRVVIHGDYGFHNLVFHDARRLTMLDFELARIEWRLTEIMMVIARFWRSLEPENIDDLQVFLSAYLPECPLSREEWRWFTAVWQYQHLRDAVRYWNSYFEVAREPRRLARARRALAHATRGRYVAQMLQDRGAAAYPERRHLWRPAEL